jgi:hypothetical protein
MADTRRTPIATDALTGRRPGGNWKAPEPDPTDRDGSKPYGTGRALPGTGILTPRKTVMGR